MNSVDLSKSLWIKKEIVNKTFWSNNNSLDFWWICWQHCNCRLNGQTTNKYKKATPRALAVTSCK